MKKELLNNVKDLCKAIKKNRKNIYISSILIGWITVAGISAGEFYKELEKSIQYQKLVDESEDKVKETNNKALEEMQTNTILVSNLMSDIEPLYYFKDNNLYNKNNEIITLKNTTQPIGFLNCKLNEKTLSNIELSKSTTKHLVLKYSNITDECIKYLPSTLESINLDYCHYITNLNELKNVCPYINYISINSASSLKDLSFIYDLPNLKEIHISNSTYITEELISYLNNNNIKHNLTKKDIENTKKVDEIIKEIIKPNMSEKERIQKVCCYVLDTLEYDITKTAESNENPLNESLESGKVVCASYAYLTNVLLTKAGITSYEITNDIHGWNMVEVDDKYYYIDLTNIDNNIANLILKLFNTSKYYMIDTEATFLTSMSNTNDSKTNIPDSLVIDVLESRNKKNLLEKYGGIPSNISEPLLWMIFILLTITSPGAIKDLIDNNREFFNNIKEDYKTIKLLKK